MAWPNYAEVLATLELSSSNEGIKEVLTSIWWLATIYFDKTIATTF